MLSSSKSSLRTQLSYFRCVYVCTHVHEFELMLLLVACFSIHELIEGLGGGGVNQHYYYSWSHLFITILCFQADSLIHMFLVQTGLLQCFHNPPNSSMTDCRIFNVLMWSFCLCIHTGDLSLQSHPKNFWWSPHRI